MDTTPNTASSSAIPEEPPLRACIDVDIYIEPVRHNSTAAYKKFIEDFREALRPHKWQKFTGEVSVSWTLYQDEQTRAETDRMADLDNMAKGLNDAIKGPDGLLIDDSQIQSLNISWIDRHFDHEPYVHLRIEDPHIVAVREPIRIYEMPDKRFYPLHVQDHIRLENMLLNALDARISYGQRIVDEILEGSDDKKIRYELTRRYGIVSPGFIKPRVVDSGFELVSYEDWRPRVPIDPNFSY
ncbi:RusA family crossover junction endodeoxyribonuclease [Rhodococcus globerulus]|uniref:RusA family crossover junction endodeoxyribonuclease n=1 Tax=Rhodococcus globerulus TaxID=33008 RepID=UPI000B878657|nr:RusA family crossover junction endodeoxyribonuclease [Rhodococcus globerulus]